MQHIVSEALPHHDDGDGAGRKRPRTAGMYQRKRAVAACLPCRARKTKCDNIRPTCGFCTKHGAQCTYTDSSKDHSSFDPASLAILERINHVVTLLEAQSTTSTYHHEDNVSPLGPTIAQAPGLAPSISPGDGNVPFDVDDDLLVDTSTFPVAGSNCESILKWPIFSDFVSGVESFVLSSEADQPITFATSRIGATLGRGIQEEDFVPLSKRFLSYVHTKNPILDVPEFTRYVTDAAETGLRWDGPSCLVLIACALGCLSTEFPTAATQDSPSGLASTIATKETGAIYYIAAKKRLGLLNPSLLSVQCLFFCGVVEMYFMRALRAWNYFNQACIQLRNLLWRQEHTRSRDEEQTGREIRRLEQRLYWSCMKSECEIQCEIPLPPSDMSRFGFPETLPSPPTELLSPPANQQDGSIESSTTDPEGERSWFYYLAEISFRRMMNRAFVAIGGDGETGWVNNFERILHQHHAFQEQIDLWCSHVPPPISIDPSGRFDNELAYHVNRRAMQCREWTHRPFLYYAIHQPLNDPLMAQALPLAKKSVELCVESQFMIQPFHRHHGTWCVARTSMTRALLLLAAARCGHIEMPPSWREAVDHALQNLQYWAEEAPDLAKAASVLQSLMDQYNT